jgi:hypothetical protein
MVLRRLLRVRLVTVGWGAAPVQGRRLQQDRCERRVLVMGPSAGAAMGTPPVPEAPRVGRRITSGTAKFRFVYKPWTGDGEVIARVASIENTRAWAKAGVMIRGGLETDAAHVFLLVSFGTGAPWSSDRCLYVTRRCALECSKVPKHCAVRDRLCRARGHEPRGWDAVHRNVRERGGPPLTHPSVARAD